MSLVSKGIKVSRGRGEVFRKALVDLGVFDQSFRIWSDEAYVYLPVLDLDDEAAGELGALGEFELVFAEFLPRERKPKAEDILGRRPHFEVVGEIAIVDPGDAEEVALALMKAHRNIKTVIAPMGPVEGEFRTRRFRHVAGETRTATLHKEHGLLYKVDLERAYFTPRLGTERLRVARQVGPSDLVIDMFAGVGPFALLMARRGAKVIAIDKNPAAVRLLRENAELNRIGNVDILEGDALEIAGVYEGRADHVVMNLPHSAHIFLTPAIKAAREGGIVHYYSISPEEDLYGKDTALIEDAALQSGADIEVIYRGMVRSYAPRQYNVVIDFRVGSEVR